MHTVNQAGRLTRAAVMALMAVTFLFTMGSTAYAKCSYCDKGGYYGKKNLEKKAVAETHRGLESKRLTSRRSAAGGASSIQSYHSTPRLHRRAGVE